MRHTLRFAATFVLVVALATLALAYTTGDADQPAPAPAVTAVPVTVPCTTDAECAAWDAAHGITGDAPTYDQQGNATCPPGTVLYDTENPDEGDSGVICTSDLIST